VLGRFRCAAAIVAVLACAAPATAHERRSAGPEVPAAGQIAQCPGRTIQPDRVISGQFGTELAKSYVMVPFRVRRGTTAIRVKYCFDRPESGTSRHTLDLGLYEPRRRGSGLWGEAEFRGWGGSSHPDVTVSAEGFSSEAQYTATPRVEPPGKTTRAFLPGRIRAGEWAVELGVAAVIPQSEGDADGKVGWRVEIDLAGDSAFADEPYRPARYDRRPARRKPGWYAGDMHVHAEHSAYGDATMSEAFGYAFRRRAAGGAGLDFVTLSDYVSGSAWGEIGRHQTRHGGKLIVRSDEVITYRGHANNHASARFVDYREGPIYELQDDGSVRRLRGDRDPRRLFREIHRFGGWTQINHPTIFPPVNPAAAALCRGCFWEYSEEETDFSQVDAYEIATGPAEFGGAPNPFTVTAIAEYERLLGLGHRIAAVGSSDSHNAGRTTSITQAPIGTATTVVHAPELSERGIKCGVQARHTYVKATGNAGPDLRFTARPHGRAAGRIRGPARAIVGDVVRARGATFTARVSGGAGRQLLVIKDGVAVATVPVTSDHFTHRFEGTDSGRWRVQLMRGTLIDTVSSPIWIEPPASAKAAGKVERSSCRRSRR
jgi:hypothetical protein